MNAFPTPIRTTLSPLPPASRSLSAYPMPASRSLPTYPSMPASRNLLAVRNLLALGSFFALGLAALPALATAQRPPAPDAHGNVFHDGSALAWGEPDNGVRFLPLYGSYDQAGESFAFRLHVQPGFELGPHTHPGVEHMTILSGSLFVGIGETMDRASATAYGPGSYLAIGAGVAAYMWAAEETVVQVHGVGPFSTDFVEPAALDDLRPHTPNREMSARRAASR